MLFESLSWVMLTLTLLIALPGALASPSPKSKKKTSTTRVTLETYPAMEEGEIIVPREAQIPALEPESLPKPDKTTSTKVAKNTRKSKKNRRVQTLGGPAPVDPPISAPASYVVNSNAPTTVMEPSPKFETVPVEKRGQILQRMHLCQSLFEESGRAYDYRSMTTAQLLEELNAVRSGERPIATRDAAGVKPSQYVPINAAPEIESDPILDAQE